MVCNFLDTAIGVIICPLPNGGSIFQSTFPFYATIFIPIYQITVWFSIFVQSFIFPLTIRKFIENNSIKGLFFIQTVNFALKLNGIYNINFWLFTTANK